MSGLENGGMTATTLTPATALPYRLAFGLRAIRAFGAAVVGVVVLGSLDEDEAAAAGVKAARPVHLGDRR